MSRPLRLEYPGAIYHITSRGNNRREIYLDPADRLDFLERLSQVGARFRWIYYAYCLMRNHYHLVVETPQPNLARGMAYLNGGYAQSFNKRHREIGHLFQSRYKALLVQRELYLLTVLRYTVLNPVRAGICKDPADYAYSSYRETLGPALKGKLTASEAVMRLFADNPEDGRRLYREFVRQGHEARSMHAEVKSELFLGDEKFVADHPDPRPSLKQLIKGLDDLEALYGAYAEWGYSMREIGRYLRKHHSTVSRLLKEYEKDRANQGN